MKKIKTIGHSREKTIGYKGITKIWLNDRWYLDITSIPYVLLDSKDLEFGELGYSCKHRSSGGFCNSCWEKFIKAGLEAIR